MNNFGSANVQHFNYACAQIKKQQSKTNHADALAIDAAAKEAALSNKLHAASAAALNTRCSRKCKKSVSSLEKQEQEVEKDV